MATSSLFSERTNERRIFTLYLFVLTAVVCLVVPIILTSSAAGQRLRKYEITVTDEFNYAADCGACPLVFGSRARVTGAFEVMLDVESQTGILQLLDATLVDFETLIGIPPMWIPQPDQPFFPDLPVLDPYRLPLTGVLEFVGEDLVLSSNGSQNSGSTTYPLPEVFRLIMSGNDAELHFVIPMIDVLPRIVRARAQLIYITPEPSSIASFALGIVSVLQYGALRRRR